MNLKGWRAWSNFLFIAPYFVLFAGFLVLPLVYGLVLSFMRWELISPAPAKFVGFGNYIEAFDDEYFIMSVWATARFVAMAVPLNLAAALAIACGINQLGARTQSFFRAVYFLPTIISIAVAGILWRWFYNGEFGFFNAMLEKVGLRVDWISDPKLAMKSIVLMTLWWTVGGAVVILMAGLKQIPQHYYEAASLDGANAWHQFRNITLPLLRPVLLFVTVMSVIGSFQVFGQTFVITEGGPERTTLTLVQYIYETAFNNYRMGYGSALSWLLFIVIAIFSVIMFRVMKEN